MERLNKKTNPKKTAVIVVDIQKDICSSIGFGARTWGHDISHLDEIVEKIIIFCQKAEEQGAEVLYTQLIYDLEKMPKSIARKLGPFAGNYMAPNTEGINFYKIKPQKNKVFIKHTISAFSNKDLIKRLKEKEIENIYVIGFNSNICVEATARHAVDLGFHTTIIKDLAGTPKFWKNHEEQTFTTFNIVLGYIKTSEDIIKDWNKYEI